MIARIRVAAVQLAAHDRIAFEQSIDAILKATRQAAAVSDLVVLPEGTFPAYVLGTKPLDMQSVARAIDGLCEIARTAATVIVAGAAACGDGRIYNSAIVVDADGSIAGRADKLFLWHFDRRWFSPGARLQAIPTSIGTLGVLICADGRIPTIARALVDRGAAALVMPTAWVTSGRNPEALENVQADLLARVRAYENRVPFVAANKCGSELGMVAYCGKSQIVDAGGEIVAIAGEREPETLFAEIAPALHAPRRAPESQPPRAKRVRQPLRIAISIDPLPEDVEERLEYLDDELGLSPVDEARARETADALPVATVDDERVLDPGGLLPYRRAGYSLICWNTSLGLPWSERLARARALELRIYVVVFDRARNRAYAVDPDGSIVAGTFGGFRLASFTFDPRKAQETLLAPGSDLGEGLDRVRELAAGSPG
jgi:predicted amidohydrolase